MSNTSARQQFDPSRYASITSPIPLLALFGGIVELIVAALVLKIDPQYQSYLVAGAIILPLTWLLVIFQLIAHYHQNLYAPKDFSEPEHFLETLSGDARAAVNKGTLGHATDYGPFKLSESTSAAGLDELRNDITQSRLSEFLASMNGAQLLALHAWHNENNSHSLALQALSLAIAKGLAASKNYSFASASLRKIGRLAEAKGFALLALDLDPNNLDAKYNLALIHKSMGNREAALPFANEVCHRGGEYHRNRIWQEFPELRALSTQEKSN